jgi:hypothetical protein
MNVGQSRAIIAAGLLATVAAGCSSRPTQTDRRFDVNKWLFGTARHADRVTLYEGLPHNFFEGYLLDEEKRTKETLDWHGFPFYSRPLPLSDADRARLLAILGDEGSFGQLGGLTKGCGGFHPDYAVEWSAGGQEYRCLICFGCSEVKIFGPGGELHCFLAARDPLRRLLVPYRTNRPISEVWPPRAAAEPDGAPPRDGGK